ncbi:hypothetical protein LTR37_009676 [Vermiconidia calcicola]|uniref:Uncharacterized protein n=1 Tax=Vermiconidia calcicola TaxID=1690605 RepID=A0ACC3N871_9PEZI|nr:hypothetical protein LTR37_009676 [Vermiconidia calcicola]
MRRAIQRCSASIPRTLTSIPSTARPCNRFIQSNSALRSTLQPHVRSLHQTSLLRQQAAAQAEQDQPGNESNGIITRFDQLAERNIVHQNVVDTLTKGMGLETLTDVQTRTINEALNGQDIIAQARTGTGKTLAFLIPILQNIISLDPDLARPAQGRRGPRTTADDIRALIVSPTRELAEQIAEEAKKVTRNTGLIVQTAVGGTQKRAGLAAIQRQGCHILVGTPGRLKDILSDPYTRVEAPDLSALVFDEADRLLDQGFWPEIQEIMRMLPTPQEKNRQTMMFSATVPKEVVNLVRETLKPGFQFVKCVGDNEDPTHANVTQKIVKLNGFENSLPTLVELCAKSIEASKQPGARPFKTIVYFNSTAEVRLAASALEMLQKPGSPSKDAFGSGRASHPWSPTKILEIHAKLSQGQRTAAANGFRKAESGILLSSDVTARGMDFPDVTHVIQMGLPTSREQYVHRIGRTARAGKEGEGWIILNPLEADEARYRLKGLPLKKDDSLEIAKLDMTKEAQVSPVAGELLAMYQGSLRKVSALEKSDVYRAQLGIHQFVGQKGTLIQYMNNLAKFGWGMSQPPMIAPGLASKLRIDRIPGVNVGHDPEQERARAMSSSGGGRGGGRGGYDRGGFGGASSGGREDRFGGRSGGRGGFGGSSGERGGYGGGRGGFGDREESAGGSGGGRYSGSRGGDDFGGGGSRGGYRDRRDPFSN